MLSAGVILHDIRHDILYDLRHDMLNTVGVMCRNVFCGVWCGVCCMVTGDVFGMRLQGAAMQAVHWHG